VCRSADSLGIVCRLCARRRFHFRGTVVFVRRSSVQEKDRDCGDNAQGDEDEQRDPHANREAVGKRGLARWDSHEPREPFVEFHSMPSFHLRRTLVPSEDLLNTQAVF
jgi:hypothetical protein